MISDPFRILNIEPTDDKKLIKKAYAVLIKQYKPDEHPERFKGIQAAYKMALSMRHWHGQQLDTASELSKKQEPLNQKTLNQEILNQEPSEFVESFSLEQAPQQSEEEVAEQQKQDELIENFYQQLHQMAFAPLVVKSKLENWKFIEDYYKIDDLNLRSQVAQEVFKRVAEYNLFQQKQNNTYLIQPTIMHYFNSIFDWSSQWNEYQHQFPEHYFSETFDIFDNKTLGTNRFKSIFSLLFRGLAFFVDVFIYAIIAFLISEMLLPDSKHITSLMLLGFVVYYLFSELFSKKHLSVGKKYIGLTVLDKFGNICDKACVLGRHLALHLITLMPFYLFFLDIISGKVFASLISMVFIGNAIIFLLYKQLVHDLITSSHVTHK